MIMMTSLDALAKQKAPCHGVPSKTLRDLWKKLSRCPGDQALRSLWNVTESLCNATVPDKITRRPMKNHGAPAKHQVPCEITTMTVPWTNIRFPVKYHGAAGQTLGPCAINFNSKFISQNMRAIKKQAKKGTTDWKKKPLG